MKIYNIYQAKTMLSQLLREALSGEEVIISKSDVPLVKLVLIEKESPARRIGSLKSQIEISEDFNEELEDFKAYRP
jgi:antitoxin (DNA-binding transcriptional repressor) of toxin-antitoxin stability system